MLTLTKILLMCSLAISIAALVNGKYADSASMALPSAGLLYVIVRDHRPERGE